MAGIQITTASSIHEIDPTAWDQLSQNRPFQSHRWYVFGERVLSGYPPVYLLAYKGKSLVARASFWLIHNEPLPSITPLLRPLVMCFLKHRPLFICRSPLSNTSGVILSKTINRPAMLSTLTEAAMRESHKKGASFVLFDYLNREDTYGWPSNMHVWEVSDPGTCMESRWESLAQYLSEPGNAKIRRHYKRTRRETRGQGIRITKHNRVPDVDTALGLIANMDKRHRNAPVPWMRTLLENIEFAEGIWLEARIGARMVGGMLILEDDAAQIALALGLAEDVPYTYFLMLYTSLGIAFERNVQLLRWGSGAYETKRRLGFDLEHNNYVTVQPTIRTLSHILRRLAPQEGES